MASQLGHHFMSSVMAAPQDSYDINSLYNCNNISIHSLNEKTHLFNSDMHVKLCYGSYNRYGIEHIPSNCTHQPPSTFRSNPKTYFADVHKYRSGDDNN